MTNNLYTDNNFLSKALKSISAGAIASFLTQPFEVIKTNMIVSPTLYFGQLHAKIIQNGWNQYMRGGTLAVVRQGYGFTIYTSIISYLNKELENITNINKYYKYSISAFVGKMIAMLFEAPLTLLKTRIQVVSNTTIRKQAIEILKNPRKEMCKGFKATFIRQSVFSLVHYNVYRFLKDDIFKPVLGRDVIFWPAFFAGTLAITMSQPFQVLRSRISLQKNVDMIRCCKNILANQGWRGFFIGFMPRLLRKPLNSGICWTILESVKQD